MARRSEGWTLYRDKRTRKYIVRFRHAGTRHTYSTRTGDPREAKVQAARMYAEVTSNRRRPQPIRGDLEVMCAEWIAATKPEVSEGTSELRGLYAFKHWVPFFETTSALTSAGVSDYTLHRLRHVTRSTVSKELSAMRRFFAWLAARGFEVPLVPSIPSNVTGKRAQPRRRVDMAAEIVERILAAMPVRTSFGNPVRAFFRVLWETGLRRSTIRALSVPEHYTVGRAELRLTKEIDKARYDRTIPITAAAVTELDAVAPAEGRIFKPIDYRQSLRTAAKKAGLPEHDVERLGYHAFRHARTTAMLERGGSLPGVAYLVGHKRVTTTNEYVHARRAAAEEALKAVSRKGRKR
jgi:site-specific recombinase XerD